MNVGQWVGRRRTVVLLLIFLLLTCALAEEGVLLLIVTENGPHPFPGVAMGTAGGAASSQTTDQNGKARLKLAAGTKPSAWVTLLIGKAPNGIAVAFISPYDGRVRVPPFDNEQENRVLVELAERGDKAMLESGPGMLAIHAAATTAASAQKKKPTNPSSQDYRRLPYTVAFNPPHLQTVSLRESISPLDYGDPTCPDEELNQAALEGAAQTFGLFVKDVKDSIAVWGGDALVWGEIMLTASVEAGGTDPFSYVRTTNQDIQFGSGTWGLRECSLQQVLLKFQQRDQKRFAEIVGIDTEWLSKTMTGPCEASVNAALQRMLDESGHLSALWRARLESLGNEHSFQHVQVQEMQLGVNEARNQASALGLQSDQAVAFLAAPAIRRLVSATPTLRESYLQDVASFTQHIGRPPDERKRLLILKDRTIESWKGQPGISPETTSNFVSLVDLFSDGSGTISGRHYDLDDFGMGARGTDDVFDPLGEKQLFDLMNQERTKQGSPLLEVDPRLTQAARKHTELMVRNHSLDHQIGDEPPMAARFSNENLPSDQQAENISVAPNAAANHESMMHSPYHRANIMNPDYNVVGVGAVQCGGALWVTQDFAHRLPEYSESQADDLLQKAINQYAKEHGLPPPTRKPQAQLQNMACDMAKKGAVNREAPAQLPRVNSVVVWRTGNPSALPPQAEAQLSKPMAAGYSVGACLAPSVGHAGEIYWVVMITY
jgi:uncharacterized protein YkwD